MWIQTLERKASLIVGILIFLTLTLGALYCLYLGDKLLYYDENDYFQIAQILAKWHFYSLDGWTLSAFRPPGYPFFLSVFVFFGAHLPFLRFLNFIALSVSLYLVYRFLRKKSPLTGLLGCLFMTCYPVLFYTAGTLYPQTLGTTLGLLAFTILFSGRELSPAKVFALGLLYGILILMIPSFIVNIGLTALWILWTVNNQRWTTCFCLLLASVIVITPWTFRNYVTFRSFVFISTNDGVNLLLGNSENTRPNSGVTTDVSAYLKRHYKSEVEANKYARKEAWKYVSSHPGASLKMYGLKFLNYFNFWNELATDEEGLLWRQMVMLISYGTILGVAIVRLFFFRSRPLEPWEIYSYLLYVLNGALLAVIFTRIRFRLPYDPLLIMIDANFIMSFFTTPSLLQNDQRESD